MTRPIRILHVVHRFGVGGLENGVANLIDTLPPERFEHSIACLTTATDFRQRIRTPGVVIHELHKKPGNDVRMLVRLWRLLRSVKPDIVHTRNLGTLECQVVAALARIRCRIHGEHGWDVHDPHGNNPKYRMLRRLCGQFVDCFVPMSKDLEQWLQTSVGIPRRKLCRIYNGVDTTRFSPADYDIDRSSFVIGHVGRLETIKNQMFLVRAFHRLLQMLPPTTSAKLTVVGDGELLGDLQAFVRDRNLADHIEITGSRDDVPQLLRTFRLFVLPSLNEGISNTILEAMACGVAVVATAVGGNDELVEHGETGALVPVNDEQALADVMLGYVTHPEKAGEHGSNGRRKIEEQFALQRMSASYASLYEKIVKEKRGLTMGKGDRTCAV